MPSLAHSHVSSVLAEATDIGVQESVLHFIQVLDRVSHFVTSQGEESPGLGRSLSFSAASG